MTQRDPLHRHTGSLYWLWPVGARRFHAFVNDGGISLCQRYDHSDVRPAPGHREFEHCVRCEREAHRA